jgi:intein/homing endonuclease
MSIKTYTDEQLYSHHIEYLSYKTMSLVCFAKNKNLIVSALRAGFKRLNLKIISQEITRRKFPVNENFFETIDSEEKAYVLGFLYADGCNHETYHRLEVSLAKQDEDILIKISKLLLNGNINIKEYKQDKWRQNKVGLYVVCQKISNDLKRLGCCARKTFILKFPDLPKHLRHHFIRGYFDGDGMLVLYERLMRGCNNKSIYAEFSIVSTREMLDEIGEIINSLGVNYKINKRHKNRKNNNFTLRVFGNQQIKIVCDFLYKDATIYLERKHEKYLRLLDMSMNFRHFFSDEEIIEFCKENSNISMTKLSKIINISRHTLSKKMKRIGLV